jgi:plastocyanin
MPRWGILAATAVAIVAFLAVAIGSPHPRAPAAPGRPPLFAASPLAAGSPVAQLPLYTPIPVNEARNVVGRVTIELTDRGFIPSRFENAINQEIHFTFVNTGTRLHNFSIDELDVDVDVAPGATKTLTIPSPRRLGHYAYTSETPEDRALGMVGTMTIFI